VRQKYRIAESKTEGDKREGTRTGLIGRRNKNMEIDMLTFFASSSLLLAEFSPSQG
jgi:hypothetical protein